MTNKIDDKEKKVLQSRTKNNVKKDLFWGINIQKGILVIPVKLRIDYKKLLNIIFTIAIYSLFIFAYFSNSAYQSGFSEYAIYLSMARDILTIILNK